MKNPDFKKYIISFWYGLKKSGRCLVISARGFREDRCMLRASALTYYTLLSIVPVMAMAFGIAKGFGFEKLLEKEVMARFAGQEEAALRIIEFSRVLLGETKGGIMAAIGVLFLLWAVIKTLSHIEDAFNTIWRINENRSLVRKFSDYLALFFTAPLLLAFSGSVTLFIKTRLVMLITESGTPLILGTMTSFFLKLLPYFAVWILFTFLYIFIPNKKIGIRAAFSGGVIAGTVFQAAQVAYINFQVGVHHYNAIYGSFAALPLFLIWLQASWIILLLGAEIAFSVESYKTLEHRGVDYGSMSLRTRKLLLLQVALLCVQRFAKGEPPASDSEIAARLEVPIRIVKPLLSDLIDCAVISEVNSSSGPRFQPARDIESLSIATVVKALDEYGLDEIPIAGTMEFEALNEALEKFSAAAVHSPGERLLKDI